MKKNFQRRYDQTVLRIRDVYPGSWFLSILDPGSRIPDPKTARKERGENFFLVLPIFVATNTVSLNWNYFNFELVKKKKNVGQYTKNYRSSSQIYGFGIRLPGSKIRKKPIPNPGSRGQKGTDSRIWNTATKASIGAVVLQNEFGFISKLKNNKTIIILHFLVLITIMYY
jgi:hypothetical protein